MNNLWTTLRSGHPVRNRRPKIGLALHDGGGRFESVKQVSTNILAALEQSYDLARYEAPPQGVADATSHALAKRIVEQSDVLLGFGKVLCPLLEARQRLGKAVPCVIVALGTFPRGALHMRTLLPLLRANDVFVVSCASDRELARAFFPDARVELLPLAVSDTAFYIVNDGERERFRSDHGLTSRSQMLLYAGRITLEKNLHTTLRVFAAVWRHLSDPYLFLAGPFSDTPFSELGAVPVAYSRALARAIDKLGIPENRVCHLGNLSQDELRAAYNAADVMVNLTLHHDENFGLGQVEAMACGTPVVGTGWGGLHDTILNGVTGHKARVIVTPLGVKVDWWDAANAIYDLLAPAHGVSRRVQASDIPMERYSFAAFAAGLNGLVDLALRGQGSNPSSLAASPFAEEFWAVCTHPERPYSRYFVGTRSFELYRQLISHYAGADFEPSNAASEERPDRVLILAAPILIFQDGDISVGDPLFPIRVQVPSEHAVAVRSLVELFTRRPAIAFTVVGTDYQSKDRAMRAGLDWMITQGLVLNSHCRNPRLAPENVQENLAVPLFVIQTIDRVTADFLALHD